MRTRRGGCAAGQLLHLLDRPQRPRPLRRPPRRLPSVAAPRDQAAPRQRSADRTWRGGVHDDAQRPLHGVASVCGVAPLPLLPPRPSGLRPPSHQVWAGGRGQRRDLPANAASRLIARRVAPLHCAEGTSGALAAVLHSDCNCNRRRSDRGVPRAAPPGRPTSRPPSTCCATWKARRRLLYPTCAPRIPSSAVACVSGRSTRRSGRCAACGASGGSSPTAAPSSESGIRPHPCPSGDTAAGGAWTANRRLVRLLSPMHSVVPSDVSAWQETVSRAGPLPQCGVLGTLEAMPLPSLHPSPSAHRRTQPTSLHTPPRAGIARH